ncbi:unnamed protein product [Nyctereutes procyonoides]|uniref:(raccoon dog) hypothetical protein n=1 Tax=Nyctereutes procyonoides TaxID=34880 RepID=A0A811YVB1_NYCPR|nr:unnamed protein product [Nyctereutes procyonoides]
MCTPEIGPIPGFVTGFGDFSSLLGIRGQRSGRLVQSHQGVEDPSSCHFLSSSRVHGRPLPLSPGHSSPFQDRDHTVGTGHAGAASSQIPGGPGLPCCVGRLHHESSMALLLLYEKRAQEGTGRVDTRPVRSSFSWSAKKCSTHESRLLPVPLPLSSCVPFLPHLSCEDATSVRPEVIPAGGISPTSGSWNLGWGPTAATSHASCSARQWPGSGPLGSPRPSSVPGRRLVCSPDPQTRSPFKVIEADDDSLCQQLVSTGVLPQLKWKRFL